MSRFDRIEVIPNLESQGTITVSVYIDGKILYNNLSIQRKLTYKNVCNTYGEFKTFREAQECLLYGSRYVNTTKMVVPPAVGFTKIWRIPPSLVANIVNKAVYANIIAPYRKYYSFYRISKTVISPSRLRKIADATVQLEQAEADGLHHITPFIIAHNESPQQLRTRYGKGMWKRICANTFTRNLLIVNATIFHEQNRVSIGEAISFRSTSLKSRRISPGVAEWIHKQTSYPLVVICGGKAYNDASGDVRQEIRNLANTVEDTIRMCERMGQTYDMSWSARRFKEVHDTLTIHMREFYERERIERDTAYAKRVADMSKIDLSNVYPQMTYENDGVVAKILPTYKSIQDEGSIMHHCVAGYASDAMSGRYLVAHMEGDGEESTLGITVSVQHDDKMRFAIQQQYKKYNHAVTSQKHLEMSRMIVNSLNELGLKREDVRKGLYSE